MALDTDSSTVLALLGAWEAPAELTVEFARRAQVQRQQEFGLLPPPVAAVDHVSIPTVEGSVPAIVYRPVGDRPEGLLVHVHGGGWTTGSPELAGPSARTLANVGNCVVLSVRYRLAPEHPFPAGLHDVYAATCWAVEHCRDFGAPDAVVVGGDSSGGNVAAAVCLMARDRGGPALAGHLLVYPATVRNIETESRHAFAEGYGLTLDTLQWYWGHYLGPEQNPDDPYISPLLAKDLSGLPPAVVVTAEYDILRDEGELYGQRLRDAGVPVVQRRFDGMIHGFLGYAGVVRSAGSAFEWIGTVLRPILSGATAAGPPAGVP